MSKDCKKKCTIDQICNPKSGRCVKIDGKIGKTILAKPNVAKPKPNKVCKDDEVLNVLSGRCIKKNGKLAKKLGIGRVSPPVPRRVSPPVPRRVSPVIAPPYTGASSLDDYDEERQKIIRVKLVSLTNTGTRKPVKVSTKNNADIIDKMNDTLYDYNMYVTDNDNVQFDGVYKTDKPGVYDIEYLFIGRDIPDEWERGTPTYLRNANFVIHMDNGLEYDVVITLF